MTILDSGQASFVGHGGSAVTLPYLVMEQVVGTTVRDALAEGPVLGVDEALRIVVGVLSALGHSHERGIVHGDISAANVMVTPSGTVKIMDFGCSQSMEDLDATHPQLIFATARYLSPEQARGLRIDARADLYSTGCLLYALLTRRPPFIADSAVALAYQHVHEPPMPPSAQRPGLGPSLDHAVLHALTKERENRYQRAEQFRTDLLTIRSNLFHAEQSEPA